MKIPGVTFSIRRLLGVDKVKRKISRETGIPTTKFGLERKAGKFVLSFLKK